jgi:hypothetical protein
MQMEAFLWLFLPVFVAGGSALLSYFIMQARMEVALAKERETLAEARAMLSSHKVTLEERVKATEEACKRQALDDFMHDIRVEERSYMKETKSLHALRKTMVMQERIFFRNIPLSNWIEREMVLEDGQDLNQLPPPVFTTTATASVSTSVANSLPASMAGPETQLAISRLLNEVKMAQEDRPEAHMAEVAPPDPREEARATVLLTQHATAFGAQ